MADVIGEAIVNLRAGTAGFLSDIAGAVGQAEKEFSKMGSGMTSSLKGAGGIMTAGITAPILAIGAFSLESAVKVDGAMNSMIRKTNETGASADKLKMSFKNVFSTVPEDANQVSTAMATVHNRLGLTGTDLENVTKQGIELARMLGTDVNSTVESAAKAFEAWHIPTNQMSGDMDKLYTVSTRTGVPLSELTNAITKGGAVASNAGVSFDTMTATVGALGSAGIPARQGVSIVTEAITKLQAEGKNAGTELPAMFERIANGTATAADKALLGQKNFDKLSGSLKDNRNNYDALMASMKDSAGAIQKQSDATMTFSDKLKIFKNDLMVAFEPLGKVLINVFTQVLTAAKPIIGIITTIMEAFSHMPAPVQLLVVAFGAILAAIGPILMIIGMIAPALAIVGPIVMGLLAPIMAISLPFLLILGAVIAIGIAIYLLYTRFKPFHDAVNQVLGWVKTLLGDLMSGNFGKLGDDFKKGIMGAIDALKKTNWGAIANDLKNGILNAIKSINWGEVLNTLKDAFIFIFAVLPALLYTFLSSVNWIGLGQQLWHGIQTALVVIGVWLWGQLSPIPGELWSGFMSALGSFGSWLWGLISGLPGQLWSGIQSALGGFGSWLSSTLSNIGPDLLSNLENALGGFGNWLAGAISGALHGVSFDTHIPGIGVVTLQHGGLVTRPTLAMIGEGGPELVTPVNSGTVSTGISSVSSSTATSKGGDINFNITFNNPTLTSASDAEKLGRTIGYQATEMLRRAGHNRG